MDKLCLFLGGRATLVNEIQCDCKCATSAHSFSDYGQFDISKGALGHIMYSAKTAQSTMDYLSIPIDDGVVNSPPNGGKHSMPVSSPSPLNCRLQSTLPVVRNGMNPKIQRELYDDEMILGAAVEVWGFLFDVAITFVFQEFHLILRGVSFGFVWQFYKKNVAKATDGGVNALRELPHLSFTIKGSLQHQRPHYLLDPEVFQLG